MQINQWITTKELAQIKNISERAVRKSITNNKYVVRKCGKSYEILITSLEENVKEKVTAVLEKSLPVIQAEIEVPQEEKELALLKYELVKKWNEYRLENEKSKTKASKEFLMMYNQKLLYENLFEKIGTVAIGTIYEWDKRLRINGDNWQVLIKNYTYGKKTAKSSLTPIEEHTFLGILLHKNQFNIAKATNWTKRVLAERGYDNFSCNMTYRRFANKYKKEHYDIWVLAREGSKSLKDKVAPYIPREPEKLEVGEVLIADGHRFAFQVINPFTGKPTRPMLVGYQDWKSGALVGFEIMLEENTQCIASALRNSIINLGKIPQFCYMDNGKAFRSNYFLNSDGITGLFTQLGIQPIFAKAYNAKAKAIERFFKEVQEDFERLLPSFVGAKINNRPAHLKRNEKFHKEHHVDFIPTIEQTIELMHKWLEYYNNEPCPRVKNKTIGEVFSEGKGSGVDIDRLNDLMMVQAIKKIGRNGVRFLNADYYDEILYGLRDIVIVKYSLFDLSEIKVYTTKGKFLCNAKRIEKVHPLANYKGNAKDVEELKQRLKQQKQLEKNTEKLLLQETRREVAMLPMIENKDLFEDRKQEFIEQGYELEVVKNPIMINGKPIFKSDIEKFEWISEQENLSEIDKKWLENYIKTDEYHAIYGHTNLRKEG